MSINIFKKSIEVYQISTNILIFLIDITFFNSDLNIILIKADMNLYEFDVILIYYKVNQMTINRILIRNRFYTIKKCKEMY